MTFNSHSFRILQAEGVILCARTCVRACVRACVWCVIMGVVVTFKSHSVRILPARTMDWWLPR